MAFSNIKGLTVEIGGDTTKLGKALEDVNKKSSNLSRELGEINKMLKLDPGNTELLAQKQKVLAEAISNTRAKLDTLKEAEKQVQQQFERGEVSEDQYRSLQREILATENKLNGYEDALRETGDAVEEVDQKTEEATESSGRFGEALQVAAKAALAAVTAASAAAAALGKAVVSAYADYEQLVGGVDTLFKDSSDKVQEYAANAYKTAGLSANAYMETVTSFSASLISSLGGDTAKAAEYADRAITDMSDNANKMGTDISSIQNAYQGFAKQNYTMLDNLKLGYGGTKEEMERLLEDASKLSGIEYDISSYADVVDAIHVIQTEMGITGTTALEAEKTISGSISTLQGALTNLVAGLGNANADVAGLAQNVIDAFVNVVNNITPVISTLIAALPAVLDSLLATVQDLLPWLLETVTGLITIVLDFLVDMTPDLVSAVTDMIIQIIPALLDQLPALLDAVLQIIENVIGAISTALPDIITVIVKIIPKLVTTLVSHVPDILQAAITLLMAIVDALPTIITELVNALPEVIDAVIDALIEAVPLLIEASIQLFMAIVKAIPQIVMALAEAMPQIIDAIINGLIGLGTMLWETIYQPIFEALGSWLSEVWTAITTWVSDVLASVGEFFTNIWTTVSTWFSDVFTKIGEFFTTVYEAIVTFFEDPFYYIGYALGVIAGKVYEFFTVTIPETWASFVDWIAGVWDNVTTFFTELPGKIWEWLTSTFERIKQFGVDVGNKAKEIGTNFINAIVSFFTQLPGKIGSFLSSALSKVISWAKEMPAKAKQAATETLNAVVNGLKALPQKVVDIGRNMVEGLWNGIKNMAGWMTEKVQSFASGILDGIKAALGVHSPSTKMAWIGEMLDKGLAKGVEDAADEPLEAMAKVSQDLLGTAGGLDGLSFDRQLQTNASLSAASAAGDNGLLSKLDKILTAIEAGQVLAIDGDTLVGATAGKLDRALGQRRVLAARGAI